MTRTHTTSSQDEKRADRISFLKSEEIREICVCIWERKFKTQTRSRPPSAIDLIDSGYYGIHDAAASYRPASILKIIDEVTEDVWTETPSLRRRWRLRWLSTVSLGRTYARTRTRRHTVEWWGGGERKYPSFLSLFRPIRDGWIWLMVNLGEWRSSSKKSLSRDRCVAFPFFSCYMRCVKWWLRDSRSTIHASRKIEFEKETETERDIQSNKYSGYGIHRNTPLRNTVIM